MLELTPDLFELLKSRSKEMPNGCWEWQWARYGGKRGGGYGHFKKNGKTYAAHRTMAALKCGLDLSDRTQKALHKCDNPPCINPDHLYAGTLSDNMKDMMSRNRMDAVWDKHAKSLRPRPPTKPKKKTSRVQGTETHCCHGHELTPDNVWVRTRFGYTFKECKECARERGVKYYERKKSRKKTVPEHTYGSVFINPHRMCPPFTETSLGPSRHPSILCHPVSLYEADSM